MKKIIWIPIVIIGLALIGLLTAYNCSKSNGNGANEETFLGHLNKLMLPLTGKVFYLPPDDLPQKNASYKNNAVARNASKTKTVVVLGKGETMKEAKNDAMIKAYKRSGFHLTSDVSYNNSDEVDETGESYTEITDVIVENSEVISAKLIDGVVHVQLRVTLTNVPSSHKGRIR